MSFQFVLIDHTTSATPPALAPGPFLQALSLALLEGCVTFDASRGFLTSDSVRVAASPTDRQPNEIACNFRDTIPEAPDALAYHQVTNGVPDIEIGCDLFSTLSSGSEALSVGVSHEVFETKRDA